MSTLRKMLQRMFVAPIWALTERFNRRVPWHKLPAKLGVVNLIIIRSKLRACNLHDTDKLRSVNVPSLRPRTASEDIGRSIDGFYNQQDAPRTGAVKTRFGRNFAFKDCAPEQAPRLFSPHPCDISRRLLTREEFKPAAHLNLLLGAWIQFMVHDWFRHGQTDLERNPRLSIDLSSGAAKGGCPLHVPMTPPDPTRPRHDGEPIRTALNRETHWWDASQLYGSELEVSNRIRAKVNGKLELKNGLLPEDPRSGLELAGVNDNWWIGLSLLHRLFVLEHNAICDELRQHYPHWPDETLFQKARLINAALMAKIHMLEWTPALLDHPALHKGMNLAWWGLFGKRGHQLIRDKRWLSWIKLELLRGIPGSRRKDHGATYCMTEEFVAVYRMHAMLPDEISVHCFDTKSTLPKRVDLPTLAGRNTRDLVLNHSMEDLFYSLGVEAPGKLCLHNFSKWLQDPRLVGHPLKPPLDLGAVDILRDRERGVPRYNKFRELLHLPRCTSFRELACNTATQRELEEVYDNIDDVDLMVGLYTEEPPPGFAISETAFRIFLLMASRRLQADPFFTTHYNAKMYTEVGLKWIDDNTFSKVLGRHHPKLASLLQNVANPFQSWRPVDVASRVSQSQRQESLAPDLETA